jgi:DNA repair protein RadC
MTALKNKGTHALMAEIGLDPDKADRGVLRELGRRYLARPFKRGEALSDPSRAVERLRARFVDELAEHFIVLTLDARMRMIGEHIIARGGLSEVHVRPREVFRPAIMDSAAAVIIAHNHPSGEPEPSNEDIALTQRLVEAGELIGIQVIDHLIVAGLDHVSLRERGLMGGRLRHAA